ncbi:MAG: DUF4830 domain-containing protein [Clostridia bacterium]|nr:DUF4830 domain-containing protein [Oscillospiraceae bacterium]MBQ2827688.1 DUF4830 domain-containing protein [Clostridia bacterium]
MFVVSVKTSKVKIILFSVFLAIIALSALLLFNAEKTSAVVSEGGISLRASDYKEREKFLSQFGWDFDVEPCAVKEVTIPWEFDETYIEYNALQKRQSLDLEKYKGQIVKKWTYNINNYPGYEDKEGKVQANLLIYNGNVIGADITILGKKAELHTIMSD